MTPRLFLELAVLPALRLLPPQMDSAEARGLILCIALQESRLTHRRQVGGPARSFVQFEPGGIRGVLDHPASRLAAASLCAEMDIPETVDGVYTAIEWNDVLCAGFARLLLYTLPDAMPGREEPMAAWTCYVDAWRPGKPRKETWEPFYADAWETVLGHPSEGVLKV